MGHDVDLVIGFNVGIVDCCVLGLTDRQTYFE